MQAALAAALTSSAYAAEGDIPPPADTNGACVTLSQIETVNAGYKPRFAPLTDSQVATAKLVAMTEALPWPDSIVKVVFGASPLIPDTMYAYAFDDKDCMVYALQFSMRLGMEILGGKPGDTPSAKPGDPS